MTQPSGFAKFFYSRWFLLAIVLIIILVGFSYARTYYREYQVKQEIARLQNEVQRLEAKKIETLKILEYVKSPAFVEDKARTELNMVKPGEKVMFLSTNTDEFGVGQENGDDVKLDNTPNPVRWWRYFFTN